MSFRIQIEPDASALLRSLSPHVVLQIGRALAELAESVPVAAGPLALASGRLELDHCAVLYDVDRAVRALRVTHVEQPADLASLAAVSAATA